MKKMLLLTACLGLAALLLAGCGDEQPYAQYTEAYQKLQEADSFAMERDGSLIQSENLAGTVDQTITLFEEDWQVARANAGDEAIVSTIITPADEAPTVSTVYFRDGYQYIQNITEPEQSYRDQIDKDFTIDIALEGIIDLPKHVIAAQSAEDTAEGRLLTFTLDSKKYYAYLYPETMEEYGYGGFSAYREPPLYTVLLDQQGRIKQVTGHFCTVNADSSAFTRDQSYTITFSQYGGVKPDFPELDEADYPDLFAEPADE